MLGAPMRFRLRPWALPFKTRGATSVTIGSATTGFFSVESATTDFLTESRSAASALLVLLVFATLTLGLSGVRWNSDFAGAAG